MVCVIDLSNAGFTMTYFIHFKTTFEQISGRTEHGVKYTTGLNVDYKSLVNKLLGFNPDCVFIIINAMNAAMICQHLAKRHCNKSIKAQGWAFAEGNVNQGAVFYFSLPQPIQETSR